MNSELPAIAVPQQTRAGSATLRQVGAAPDACAVLAAALDAAVAALDPGVVRGRPAGPVLDAVVAEFADAVAPVEPALVVRDPSDALRVVQGYLANAFAQAVAGDVDATRSALVAARAALVHLVAERDDDTRA